MNASLTALEKLLAASERHSSLVCIGLDPDLSRMPACVLATDEPIVSFNRAIIEATSDLVAAYKPNLAFYEALGLRGWQALRATIALVPRDIPVILDAKRGDIGNTARMYAASLYEELGGDGCTVSPYMGREAIQPFVDHADKLTFLLAATSNPGAEELQMARDAEGTPVYLKVARMARELDGKPGGVGLVAGATRSEQLGEIRREAPAQWLLVPGVGAQGGDLAESLRVGLDAKGRGVLINTSRAVLYASNGADYAAAARSATRALRDEINTHRRA